MLKKCGEKGKPVERQGHKTTGSKVRKHYDSLVAAAK